MSYQLGLPAALAKRGLTVEVVPGWETRSAGSFNPKGAVCHWTAGPRGATTRPSLNVVVNGRPDLDGPLCNVYLDRDGIAVVVAAGRANHAGLGGWRGLVGNSSVFGTECECGGDGDWTDAQRWAYPRVNAAYCDLGGFGVEMVCGHEEWAPTRKIDIRDYTMPKMRADVAAVLANPDPTPAPVEDDDMKIIQSPGRGIAVVGPGYFRGLDKESVPVATGMYGQPYVTNDRGFDLAKAMCLQGVTLDPAAIAAAVVAALPANGDGAPVDVDALAAKVVDDLAARIAS